MTIAMKPSAKPRTPKTTPKIARLRALGAGPEKDILMNRIDQGRNILCPGIIYACTRW